MRNKILFLTTLIVSLLTFSTLIYAEEMKYEDFKFRCYNVIDELSMTDANTQECIDLMKEHYYTIYNAEKWWNTEEEQNALRLFGVSCAYFEEFFDEGTVADEVSRLGWNALESFYNNEEDFYLKMELVKDCFYENLGIHFFENAYESGQYKVGFDIPAGEYMLFTEGGRGYFALSTDANGNDIITNENFEYNNIIAIRDGEYFELSRCVAVPMAEVGELDINKADMMKVGLHLPAGEYKLLATSDRGYYCIYGDNRQDDIISNDNFEGSAYINVTDGQYLVLSRCEFAQ